MRHLSFALYEAYCGGTSIEDLAVRLRLPADFVEARIEAARLCIMAGMMVEESSTSDLWSA